MSENTATSIGFLKGKMNAVENRLDRLETQIDKRLTNLEVKVDALSDALNGLVSQSKGGWKTLFAIGAIMTFLITVAGFVLTYMLGVGLK